MKRVKNKDRVQTMRMLLDDKELLEKPTKDELIRMFKLICNNGSTSPASLELFNEAVNIPKA